jgi:hypothetical protein
MNFSQAQQYIKQRLAGIYRASTTTTVESFVLPPYEEPKTAAPPEIQAFLNKYNLTPRQIYDVMDNFDLPASKITQTERTMRKRVLLGIKETLAAEYAKMKATLVVERMSVTDNVPPPPESVPIQVNPMVNMLGDNMEPMVNMVDRVLSLMIDEIDRIENPVSCPQAPACPKAAECPKDNNMIFYAVIALLVIILIVMMVMRKSSSD